MLMELPPECKIPPAWVEPVPHGRGTGYKCPLAVKALMKVRIPNKTAFRGSYILGAKGVAEYIGVVRQTVWNWSCGDSMDKTSFLSLCRLWNEHHED